MSRQSLLAIAQAGSWRIFDRTVRPDDVEPSQLGELTYKTSVDRGLFRAWKCYLVIEMAKLSGRRVSTACQEHIATPYRVMFGTSLIVITRRNFS